MTEKDKDFELHQEVDVEAKCLVHGSKYISMHPRIGNLGHGRAFIDLGQAHCRGPGCNGTSQWITLELVVTRWEKATAEQYRTALKHALEMEIGAAMAAGPPLVEDEDEEEEVPVAPVPRPGQPAPAQPGSAALPFRPPSFGGVRAGVPSPGDGKHEA